MAESRYEQIVATIVALIAAIIADGGATAWHSYGSERGGTIRHPGLQNKLFDNSLDTLCVVIPDTSAKRRETNKTHIAEARIDVFAARQFEGDGEPFAAPPVPNRATLQSRLAQDIERKLMADPALNAFRGFEVLNLRVVNEDRSPEVTWSEAWAAVVLRLAIEFRYRPEAP